MDRGERQGYPEVSDLRRVTTGPTQTCGRRDYGITITNCELADPESEGRSEASVRVAKVDLAYTAAFGETRPVGWSPPSAKQAHLFGPLHTAENCSGPGQRRRVGRGHVGRRGGERGDSPPPLSSQAPADVPPYQGWTRGLVMRLVCPLNCRSCHDEPPKDWSCHFVWARFGHGEVEGRCIQSTALTSQVEAKTVPRRNVRDDRPSRPSRIPHRCGMFLRRSSALLVVPVVLPCAYGCSEAVRVD